MKKVYLSKVVSKKRKRTDSDSSSSSSVFSKILPVSMVSNKNKGNKETLTAKESESISLLIDTISQIQKTQDGNNETSKKAEA